MYSTVREIHTAIDSGLQQVNSNRKQAFMPEQYDIILNAVILQYIEDKIDPKSNPKKDGFEDNQRRVDELKELKKSVTLRLYNDTKNRKYTYIPSDYYKLIAGGCIIQNHYNKKKLTNVSNNETLYIYKLLFPDDIPSAQGVKSYFNTRIRSTSAFDKTFTKNTYSKDSKFEIINYFLDYFKKELNYNIYWEYYDGTYYNNTFIITSNVAITNTIILTYTKGSDNTLLTSNATSSTSTLVYNTTIGNVIDAAIELISSKEKAESLKNFYISKNRFDQPLCTEDNNKFNVYFDDKFVPLTIDFNYIIKPRLVNYYFNIMPEIKINDEIITRAIDKLKVFIKDEQAYNMFNNQVQKIQ